MWKWDNGKGGKTTFILAYFKNFSRKIYDKDRERQLQLLLKLSFSTD